jgi:hypothetical protein
MNMPDFVRFEPKQAVRGEVIVPVSPLADDDVYTRLGKTLNNTMSYVIEGGEAVNWPTCAAVVRMFSGLQPSQAVLLVAGPKGFVRRTERLRGSGKYKDDKESLSSSMLNDMCYVFPTDEAIFSFQHVLCAPAVRVEHVGVAALAAIGYSFGIFVAIICPSAKTTGRVHRVLVCVVLNGGYVVVNEEVYASSVYVSDKVTAATRHCLLTFSSKAQELWTSSAGSSTPLEDDRISNIPCMVPVIAHVMGFDEAMCAKQEDSLAASLLSLLCGGGEGNLTADAIMLPFRTGNPPAVVLHRMKLQNAGLVSSGDILRGAAVLSTQADHRSKCVFQPFI